MRPYAPANRCTKVFAGHVHTFEKNLLRCDWSPDGSKVRRRGGGGAARGATVQHCSATCRCRRPPGPRAPAPRPPPPPPGPTTLQVTAGSGDRCVYVWNAATRNLMYKLPGHSGSVNECAPAAVGGKGGAAGLACTLASPPPAAHACLRLGPAPNLSPAAPCPPLPAGWCSTPRSRLWAPPPQTKQSTWESWRSDRVAYCRRSDNASHLPPGWPAQPRAAAPACHVRRTGGTAGSHVAQQRWAALALHVVNRACKWRGRASNAFGGGGQHGRGDGWARDRTRRFGSISVVQSSQKGGCLPCGHVSVKEARARAVGHPSAPRSVLQRLPAAGAAGAPGRPPPQALALC